MAIYYAAAAKNKTEQNMHNFSKCPDPKGKLIRI